MTRRLLLARHARTGPDHAGRLIGATDLSLDASGKVQARALGSAVMRYGPAICWSSPLLRCKQTAQMIHPEFPTEIEPDLREVDFGRWENRTFGEVAQSEPQAVAEWSDFAADFAFPGGESLRDFLARVQAVAARLADLDVDTVLAVTHGGVIRAMLCHLLGLEARQYVAFQVDYASLVVLNLFGERGVLAALESAEGREVACGCH